MAAFGAFSLFSLLIAGSAIYRGWVLSILWGWFAVPLGAPSLTIAQAIGVSLVVGFMTYHTTRNKGDADVDIGYAITAAILLPLFSLGIGAIVRVWLP